MVWIIIICFVVLVALAVFIYTIPSDSAPKPKKKSKEQKAKEMAEVTLNAEVAKDWKSIAERSTSPPPTPIRLGSRRF